MWGYGHTHTHFGNREGPAGWRVAWGPAGAWEDRGTAQGPGWGCGWRAGWCTSGFPAERCARPAASGRSPRPEDGRDAAPGPEEPAPGCREPRPRASAQPPGGTHGELALNFAGPTGQRPEAGAGTRAPLPRWPALPALARLRRGPSPLPSSSSLAPCSLSLSPSPARRLLLTRPPAPGAARPERSRG